MKEGNRSSIINFDIKKKYDNEEVTIIKLDDDIENIKLDKNTTNLNVNEKIKKEMKNNLHEYEKEPTYKRKGINFKD